MLIGGTEHEGGPKRGIPHPRGSKVVRGHLDQGRLPRDAGPKTDCSRLSQILPDMKESCVNKEIMVCPGSGL